MSAQGRIEALEAELAAANARIAELEAAVTTRTTGPPRMAGAAAQAAQQRIDRSPTASVWAICTVDCRRMMTLWIGTPGAAGGGVMDERTDRSG